MKRDLTPRPLADKAREVVAVAVVLIQQRQDQYLRAAALQFPPKCIEARTRSSNGMTASALSLVSAVGAMASIVGIVDDARYVLAAETSQPELFYAYRQLTWSRVRWSRRGDKKH